MGQYEQTHTPIVETAQDLRAIAARQFHAATPVVYLQGVASIQDGLQGWFEWQALTSSADDGLSVFKPNWVLPNESGRWVRVTFGTTNSAFTAKSVTSNYQIGPLDYLVQADATGGGFTVTAPPIATAQKRPIVIKKIDNSANAVTITGDATFDGGASYILGMKGGVSIGPTDQSNWAVF